ncbi:hypothetical protein Pfo_013677 [Paulownia fortunei]|nr:hypothetical protein Pfo_013677 [Paulownia fortunei]
MFVVSANVWSARVLTVTYIVSNAATNSTSLIQNRTLPVSPLLPSPLTALEFPPTIPSRGDSRVLTCNLQTTSV